MLVAPRVAPPARGLFDGAFEELFDELFDGFFAELFAPPAFTPDLGLGLARAQPLPWLFLVLFGALAFSPSGGWGSRRRSTSASVSSRICPTARSGSLSDPIPTRRSRCTG